jgi:hypothetical protein
MAGLKCDSRLQHESKSAARRSHDDRKVSSLIGSFVRGEKKTSPRIARLASLRGAHPVALPIL